MTTHNIDRSLVAAIARRSLEAMSCIDGRFKTDAISELIQSFIRIETNASLTPVEALQDHFDAMTLIASDLKSLMALKSVPAIFTNCENMLRYLRDVEGAGIRVT